MADPGPLSPTRALVAFVERLRQAGVPVSMVETIDAVQAMQFVDLSDRRAFHAALRAALVKRAEHTPRFDALFDLFFAGVFARVNPEPAVPNGGSSEGEEGQELLDALVAALGQHDEAALRALARLAVERYGGVDPQRSAGAAYYLYRTLRQVDLANLLRRTLRERRARAGDLTELDERLLREESSQQIEQLRQRIAEAIRERLAATHGPLEAARSTQQPPIEDVDILGASPTQLKLLREAIRPLARTLAARMQRRRQRRRRRGHLEIRRTMRQALSTGGVPMQPVFRQPRLSRPNLVVLADVSGSVAEFAEFTMALLDALSQEFSRVRFFAFVDGVDEVTEIVERCHGRLDSANLLAGTRVVSTDGHSDYGKVFRRFRDIYARQALDGRATIILTGDARGNYRDPSVDALRSIRARARHLYWLNPEPRADWATADSLMSAYAPICDGVYEVRSLRQLSTFIEAIT